MKQDKRIVVTGIGPVTSIGVGKNELWEALLAGKTGLIQEEVKLDGDTIEKFFIHKIENLNIDIFGLDKQILRDIEQWKGEKGPIDLYYLMAAAKLALGDAGLNGVTERDNIGLILTHENPGLDHFYSAMIDEFSKLKPAPDTKNFKEFFFREFFRKFEKRGYELQTFMFLFHVARALDIHGYSLFLNNACASGLYALEAAADAIRTNKCETMVVAAADCGSVYKYLWFKSAGVYAEDGKTKPFAKDSNGFVSGDTGAALILESLENAEKRGAYIYAEYSGGGFHLEGWKVVTPDVGGDSYKKALKQSLQISNIAKEDIDLLLPHGVGLAVTDHYEAKTITDVFGKNSQKPLITALKPYIGHCLGATAIIETIILLLSLKNNLVLPTLNSEEVNSKHNIQLVKEQAKKDLTTVMKIACGFAGHNAACIFRKLN